MTTEPSGDNATVLWRIEQAESRLDKIDDAIKPVGRIEERMDNIEDNYSLLREGQARLTAAGYAVAASVVGAAIISMVLR